ncbi:PREDICTED: auxilin-related protein 1 isoform X2 [Tarenaya hassleriana]|uniref:auxilin-related protein 1 isoform X2 n=1 Tax=Tarenaya hassleriana TaxID=28532 RepID=UPI00053C1398|nr:PREDICTED: auxilin-related protein 1 isoform X2 [Tarenaya hassleriana]
MDEFGVLTERYGLKPQGKSAPMAAAKRSANPNNGQSWHFGSNINTKPTSYSSDRSKNADSGNASLFDGDDIFSKSKPVHRVDMNSGGFDDFGAFGGLNKSSNTSGNSKPSFGDDLMFPNVGNSGAKNATSINGYGDDIFDGTMKSKISPSVDKDDIFGSFSSPAKQNGSVDDLLGDFSQFGTKSKSWNQNSSGNLAKDAADFDELIPGFGESAPPSSGTAKSTTAVDDPFVVLESTSASGHSSSGVFVDPLEDFAFSVSSNGTKPSNSSQTSTKLRPPPKPAQKVNEVKSSGMSSIDALEEFAMGRERPNKYNEAEDVRTKKQQTSVDDLDFFSSSVSRSSSAPKSRATTDIFSKPVFNAKKTSNGVQSSAKKPVPPANLVDDFSSVFGADPLFGEFEDIPGESEERRNARWDRERRTKNRVAQAVADMNHRDRQTQLEQEERSRIAETINAEIKRWAAGKEGNMRALLSSLQIFPFWIHDAGTLARMWLAASFSDGFDHFHSSQESI